MGDTREPRARGNLSQTPFAHLVLYFHRERSTGTLVIKRDVVDLKLFVREGRIVAGKPLERGATLQPGLLSLCAERDAAYAFFSEDLLEGATGVTRGTVDPLTFVTESLRKHARDDVVDEVLGRYRGLIFELRQEVDLRRLGLRPREITVLETLSTRPCDEDTLIERAALSPEEVRRLLYLLILHKYVRVERVASDGSDDRPAATISPGWRHESMRPPAPDSSRPGKATSSVPARRATASLRASRPPPSARPATSVPAWQQLASRRAASMSQMPPPAQVPSVAPPPVEALDAAGKLRRAEQLCERRSYDAALRIADELIKEDDTVAEHHAMRAFVCYQTWSSGAPPKTVNESLRRALQIDAENVRALYLRGMVLKRTGKEREARRYFAKAASLDPKHVDARRELRLARMRQDK